MWYMLLIYLPIDKIFETFIYLIRFCYVVVNFMLRVIS